jgi:PTS system nitrogen regulatory IIA component
MRIAEFLREDLVFPDLAATDKAGVLGELCAGLARAVPGLSAARLTEVAIPHGKLPGIAGLIAAFARSRKGVDFASIDGKPTYLFFVLFAPENSAGLHLKALARISRLFKQPQFRQSILAAAGAAEIFRIISEEDAKD